jgi:sugar transferase EpsL
VGHVKRLVDLVVGATMLAVASPVIGVVALAIRTVDGSPVLFRQRRSGIGGRPFTMVKFRTMHTPADGQRGPTSDAARTTRLGGVLRSSSLDELPSLVHVVSGRLSLVGPRPLPVDYLQRYSDHQARRLEVRPGVTGWAQVNGRNLLSWDERFELDVWYVDHRSARLDLRILASTVRQVLRREGVDHHEGVTMTEFLGPGS